MSGKLLVEQRADAVFVLEEIKRKISQCEHKFHVCEMYLAVCNDRFIRRQERYCSVCGIIEIKTQYTPSGSWIDWERKQ